MFVVGQWGIPREALQELMIDPGLLVSLRNRCRWRNIPGIIYFLFQSALNHTPADEVAGLIEA